MKRRGVGCKQVMAGLVLAASGILAGCGGGDGGSGTVATAQPGTLSVSLTDAPACGYEQVNVTVSKVRVHKSSTAESGDAGWIDIAVDPNHNRVNLLNLNDPTQPNLALHTLGETSLGAGHYTQVRLVLVPNTGSPIQPFSNSIVLQGQTQEIKLDTPSGVQSGIKLVNEFDVPSGQRVDLLLDFDACHSIVQRGNGTYALKPVIKVIPYVLNGIEGFVDLDDSDQPGTNVVVSAQINGEIVRATVPNMSSDPALRGKFFLARLPGSPQVGDFPARYDVVITARNSTDTCCATSVIAGVPVTSRINVTMISDRDHKFHFEQSGFYTIGDTVALINPPSPPSPPAVDDRDDARVVVAAKQALAAGPTVTVRTVAASSVTGDPVGDYLYGLRLPIAAPLRAVYGPLPIIPSVSGQSGVAGIYTVYGSAQTPTAAYTVQDPLPSSVSIVVGDDLSRDFTLAP